MKNDYSPSWNASKQPRKQRKYRYNAPAHVRTAFMSAHLNKALREQYKRRSIPLRSGDKVKVLRGNHKGKTGTIDRVDRKLLKVYLAGIEATRKDGSKALYAFAPSNLQVEELKKDKRRIEEKK